MTPQAARRRADTRQKTKNSLPLKSTSMARCQSPLRQQVQQLQNATKSEIRRKEKPIMPPEAATTDLRPRQQSSQKSPENSRETPLKPSE